MYVVAFAYPAAGRDSFKLKHFLEVHLPLGVGLCRKHLNLVPVKIVVHGPLADGAGGDPALGAVSQVYFHTRAEAEKFLTLFSFPEAAQKLIADFPNYTSGAPAVLIGEVSEFGDLPGLISKEAG